jgi:Polyketide cyclase / dehydrase and lipid transport
LASYRFLSAWCLDAPIADVYAAIHDAERWPEWWRGVESVTELEPGDEDGVGSVARHRWRSRLPYTVEFDVQTTRVERPFLLEGLASGELAGEGRWRLAEGQGTTVLYEWNVRTTPWWMNLLAPLGRPVFAWNHELVMRQGGEGLAWRLGAPLLARS